MDFKENQRCIAEKDTSFGVLHTVQKRPKMSVKGSAAAFGKGNLQSAADIIVRCCRRWFRAEMQAMPAYRLS